LDETFFCKGDTMTENILGIIIRTSIIGGLCLIGFIIAVFKFKDIKLNLGKANIDMSKTLKTSNRNIEMCMIYAEVKVDTILGFILDVYRLELQKINNQATESKEFINFGNFLERIRRKMLDDIRKSIKDNIFNNIENIITDIEGLFDVHYTGEFISRKEIGSILSEKCYEDIYDKLKLTFNYAKDLLNAK
jgi:hypothetical protein